MPGAEIVHQLATAQRMFPLLDRVGVVVGHLAILDDKPMHHARGISIVGQRIDRFFPQRSQAVLAEPRPV
jgi:hypothetical protein